MKKFSSVALLFFCITSLSAAPFSDIYFFGDSLTDIGNQTQPPFIAPVVNPGGKLWSQDLAHDLGLSTKASSNGGNNYAFAGAETNSESLDFTNNGVFTQTDSFFSTHANHFDKHALYAYWAGANDFFAGQDQVSQSIDNIDTVISRLHNAGAQYLLIFNLPDLSKTPFGYNVDPMLQQIMAAYTIDFNSQLKQRLSHKNYNIIQLDIYGALSEIINEHSRFGFTNITGKLEDCPSCDPDTFLFFNDIHPTSAGQRLVADYALGVIQGPMYIAQMRQSAESIANAVNSTLDQTFMNFHGENSAHSRMPHVSVSTTQHTASQSPVDLTAPGLANHAQHISVNVSQALTNDFLLGADLHHASEEITYSKGAGGYKVNATLLSAFGSYQQKAFYFDASVNVGRNYFYSDRDIALGISSDHAHGSTQGYQYGGHVVTGAWLKTLPFKTGPFLEMNVTHNQINSFTETGAQASNLKFDPQSQTTTDSGLGWQVMLNNNWQNIQWNNFARASAHYRWQNSSDTMGAGLVSLAGSHFAIPISIPKGLQFATQIGITAQFNEAISLGTQYAGRFGAHQFADHVLSLNFGWTI